MTPLRLIRRFPWFHRLIHRDPQTACLICRYVWWRLEREPGFNEAMARGRADFEAGRFVVAPPGKLRGVFAENPDDYGPPA